MGLGAWIDRTRSRFEARQWDELLYESTYELYAGVWRLGTLLPLPAENVFDREWDVLVVLDGCRVDLMREVADEYDFVDDVERVRSVGSMSIEWLSNTFDADRYGPEMRETAYVSGNVFTRETLSVDDLLALDEVWRYGWDDDLQTVPARPVTDRAIAAGRDLDPDRLIVHYMQPHHPFVGDDRFRDEYDVDPFRRDDESRVARSVWDALRRGEVDRTAVWDSYRNNLRYVLDDVAVLRSNVDADRMVLTADHGNAVGEWGVYDHPTGFPHPSVKTVPWVETTATDRGTHDPDTDPETDDADADVEERLRSLGYR